MPIEVELPDGTIAEFPDGTDSATMERALSSYRAAPKKQDAPDFGNVQTTVGGTNAIRGPRKPAPKRTAAELTGISDAQMNPAYREPVGVGRRLLETVMPLANPQFRQGWGQTFSSAGRGLKQFANEAEMVQTGLYAGLLNRLGFDGNKVVRERGLPLQDRRAALQQEAAQMRETDRPLLKTPYGFLGAATGTAAQFLGPGMALRGTAVGRALLPQTVGGNALQGLALGALQPFTSDGDRAMNASLGGLAGGVGAGIPAVGGAIVRRIRAPRVSGAERRAGNALLETLQDGQLGYEQSQVPGVSRSLGEGTLNPQIMAIERNARRDYPQMFEGGDLANNAARVDILRGIAGDEAAMEAAKQARDKASEQARNAAFSEAKVFDEASRRQNDFYRAMSLGSPVPDATGKGALSSSVRDYAQGLSGREEVRRVVERVASSIDAAPDSISGLYNARKNLTDILEGKAGSETQAARAATRELMQLRDMIDGEISKRATVGGVGPSSWGNYLSKYQQGSAPINRMQLGEEIMKRGAPGGQPDKLGNPELLPASFGRAMKASDRLAVNATGFKKAKAADILTADDLRNLGAINEDLRRISLRQTNKAQPGSATSESGALRNRLAQRAMNVSLPGPVGGAMGEVLQNQMRGAQAATLEKIAYLVANPAEAQRVLNALKGRERQALEQALIAFGGRSGVVSSTLAE